MLYLCEALGIHIEMVTAAGAESSARDFEAIHKTGSIQNKKQTKMNKLNKCILESRSIKGGANRNTKR